jgi:hypothetical protein
MSIRKQYIYDKETYDLLLKAQAQMGLKQAEIVRYAVQRISEGILNGTAKKEDIIEKARLVTLEREKE